MVEISQTFASVRVDQTVEISLLADRAEEGVTPDLMLLHKWAQHVALHKWTAVCMNISASAINRGDKLRTCRDVALAERLRQ